MNHIIFLPTMLYQFWLICLALCLTATADFSKDAIKQAYFGTFAVHLTDTESVADSNSSHASATAEQPLPPIHDLPPFPGYQWCAVDATSWQAALAAAVICLGSIAVSTLLQLHRRWHEPQAIRLRKAKACLRLFARTPDVLPDEAVIDALRAISGSPPGASLSAIALRLEARRHDVAAACRTLEQTRFNTADSSAAVKTLKRILRIGLPCLLCLLAGCEGITRFTWYSDWSQGHLLASQGKLPEAAAVFEKLVTVMPSSDTLSETMARLRTAVKPRHGDTAEAWHLHARTWRESRQFSRRFLWLNVLPEVALPVMTAALLLGAYACIRCRWRTAILLILTALSAGVLAAFPLSQRLSLRSQAISLTELRRTPDEDGELLTSADIQVVHIQSSTAIGDYCRVQAATVTGWIPARQVLLFKF